jgi:hypothetical protein
MSNVAINILAEFTGVSAFKKADSSVAKLNKTVKNLAGTLGVAFGTAAVVRFGKAAANAFMQDQKEAVRLANAVKNLGLEFSNPAITQYIDSLSKSSSVTDSQLRPAFQALLTTTGSLTKSQELLGQAIDISVGSGVELATVSQDLANAYVGNTKGLKKYNLGLTQAELKTAKFADVQKKLNDQYKGSNAAYLATYAGKMQSLSTAAGEASEKIGGALIDSVMLLSGSSGIDDLITKIDRLADRTVGFIDRFSEGLAIITAIKDSNLGNMAKNIQAVQVEAYNARLRRNAGKAFEGVNIPKTPQQIAAEAKAAADAAKRARDIANATKKNTAELKKQTALKKAGTVFDLDQIQILAALRGKISEEDRIRLQAQLAILNDNDVLASSLTKQILMAQDESGKLYKFFLAIGDTTIKNPFAFLDEWIIQFQKKLDGLKMPTFVLPPSTGNVPGFTPEYIFPQGPKPGDPGFIGPVPVIPSTNVTTLPITTAQGYAGAGSTAMAERQQYIELKITGDGDLTNSIAKNLMQQSLSTGNQTYVNRRTGGFE